nr:hypothetical protein GCM10023233_24540 [Brevibacterium otitidis]
MSILTSLRRHRLLALWAVSSLILAAGGWAVGFTMRADERTLSAAEESRARGTVEVTRQALTAEHTAVGTFHSGTVEKVPAPGDGKKVVTAAKVKPGDRVSSGALLALVSGTPVFAVDIPFPFYREMRSGDSGDDVEALNQLLSSLGYAAGNGRTFTDRTAAGLTSFYRDRGQTVPKESAEESPDESHGGSDHDGRPADGAANSRSHGEPGQSGRSVAAHETSVIAVPQHFYRLRSDDTTIASIQGVGAELGDDDALAELRSGSPFVKLRVDLAAIDTVKSYQEESKTVALSLHAADDSAGSSLTGAVTGISEFTDAPPDGEEKAGYDVTIAVRDDIDGVSDDSSVTARFASEAEDDSLVVPLIAVRSDGKGDFLLVLEGDSERRCAVRLGKDAGGVVAIEPDRACADEGTRVAVDS